MATDQHSILFFDGICNLCNQAVGFVIRHDKRARIHFATLQGNMGEEARRHIQATKGTVPDSLIFLDKGVYYTKSAAALRVAGYLNGGWPLMKIFLIVPTFLRNAVYDYIAGHRYKWFGKQDACLLPTPALKARFIEEG